MATDDNDTKLESEPAGGDSPNIARRDLLLSIGSIVLYTVLAFGVILALNAKAGLAMNWPGRAPQGEDAVSISIVHSNDAWGYTDPCG
ncbi:MAG: hypothetical protein GX552_11575 [Chloroflexi bacterium]|jgi:hypothetical protein|nr:hypothetical protein [Chloroflexota bacterium]